MINGINIVVLQLGSNMEDKKRMLSDARRHIADTIGEVDKLSSLYESEPWGNADLNWFLNQVVIVKTLLSSSALLVRCKEIELMMGRQKKTTTQYENRLIDIDIIFFNDEVVRAPDLQIPHKRIPQRRFVLEPLVELIPYYIHPVEGETMKYLLDNCEDKLVVNQK
jgi:2-amino-4-hydroxy-6-hydroxymethyldihydropteridine diphosphokinase